jgi:hypothetical protein
MRGTSLPFRAFKARYIHPVALDRGHQALQLPFDSLHRLLSILVSPILADIDSGDVSLLSVLAS